MDGRVEGYSKVSWTGLDSGLVALGGSESLWKLALIDVIVGAAPLGEDWEISLSLSLEPRNHISVTAFSGPYLYERPQE